MSRQEGFPALLNRKRLQTIGVEVGVWRGDFSDAVLSRWPQGTLVMVDPWCEQPRKDYPDPTIVGVNWTDVRRSALAVAAKHSMRVRVVQMKSLDAADTFEDASLDWVYLDAVHTFEAVIADLRAWVPKVRMGGVIAGHDYIEGFRGDIDVVRAVRSFFGEDLIRVIEDRIPSWYVEL